MTKKFTKPEKQGEYFKNGKFYCFSERNIHVMQAWPDPRSWLKSSRKGWQPERKWADSFFCHRLHKELERPPYEPPEPHPLPETPSHASITKVLEAFGGTIDTAAADQIQKQNRARFAEWRHKHAVLDFFEQIPEDLRRIVQSYGERRWHILNLLARCPGADELHHSNPALCYMLASNWVFRKPAVQRPTRAARSLIRRPQRQILDWLGFPATEAVRRILAKINPASLSVNNLLYLRTALADSGICKLLAHLPAINAGVLYLVNSKATRSSITPRLLAEVTADPEQLSEATTYQILCDTLNMAGMTGDTSCPQLFGTIQRLIKAHDRLTERLNTMFDDGPEILSGLRGVPLTLPAPPFPGSEAITPITTVRELFEEGKMMHHCVGSYARMVADRYVYVYRVTEPVRATAAICLRDNQWSLFQTTGPRNAVIPIPIIEQIQRAILGEREAYA